MLKRKTIQFYNYLNLKLSDNTITAKFNFICYFFGGFDGVY